MEVALPRDLAQDAALARRAHGEVCRQRGVFSARDRLIGGDAGAWDVQVRDQKIKEETEKVRGETFASELRYNDKVLCLLQDRERRDRRNLCQAINDFQQNFQKPETRREFDLSDPLALKKDLPARLSDHDTRNTISGMQKFMGEDLNFLERKKFQEEQNREWSLQQQREWAEARAQHKAAEDLHTRTRLQFDETARHLEKLEVATRKALCSTVKDFNRKQAVESAERKRQEREQEEEDNRAEMASLLHGDLLLEKPQQGPPQCRLHDRWKGMTREQLDEIRRTQKQQALEKLRLQEEERQSCMDWDQRRVQKARADMLEERQRQREKRELRKDLDHNNLRLAAEQRARRKCIEEDSTNPPTSDYFAQFNTRSR